MGKIKNQTQQQKEIHNCAVKIRDINGKAVERYTNVLYTHTADIYASRVLEV